jgi:hypothetical protein
LSEEEKKNQRKLLQEKALKVQSLINERIKNSSIDKTKDESEDDEEIDERDEESLINIGRESESSIGKKKEVHWSDDYNNRESDDSEDDSDEDIVEDKTNVIYVKHTKIDNFNENELVSCEKQDLLIKTPADIYKIFHKPKSILKAHVSSESEEVVNNEKKTASTTVDQDEKSIVNVDFQPHKVIRIQLIKVNSYFIFQ